MHLSDVRVGGCAYHVPSMRAFERRARGRVRAFERHAHGGCAYHVPGCVHLSDMRVGGCVHHVPGMCAFERRARGRVCLRCARHACI